jgi:sulfur relay (sulfurtransferase) complex TusBCD TusD component (DsrE family)
MNMNALRIFILTIAIAVSFSVSAGPNDPLFVSLTTDEPHRARMALSFGKHHFDNGHLLSVFLSDKGVFIGVKSGAGKYAEQQTLLNDIMKAGGQVIMCPMCLRHYGLTESDLLPGVKMGSPKVTGDALFKDGTKTMSW